MHFLREKEFEQQTPKDRERTCDALEYVDDPINHEFYNVCGFNLPPDVLHDVLKSYVPYKIKLMLKHFI